MSSRTFPCEILLGTFHPKSCDRKFLLNYIPICLFVSTLNLSRVGGTQDFGNGLSGWGLAEAGLVYLEALLSVGRYVILEWLTYWEVKLLLKGSKSAPQPPKGWKRNAHASADYFH
jgi:hypothetical protein